MTDLSVYGLTSDIRVSGYIGAISFPFKTEPQPIREELEEHSSGSQEAFSSTSATNWLFDSEPVISLWGPTFLI